MHKDIIIIGAGVSGIGAACHLSRKHPNKSYIILESRKELGGTWSLFKYPGIRSDSDMYTFGYSFKTWDNPKSFADSGVIKLSRSRAFFISSTDLLVCFEYISLRRFFNERTSLAWISISVA